MNRMRQEGRSIGRVGLAMAGFLTPLVAGCGPTYNDYYRDAQQALIRREYGPARHFLEECDRRKPRRVEVLHDLGVCSVMIAQDRFRQMNAPAAMRELDRAVAYFDAALDEKPDHFASLKGLNVALKLKGEFDEALEKAEWAAKFIGPSAKQYVFLAQELEERGDFDGALLRHRQAVAMEPDDIEARIAFARFLLRRSDEAAAIAHMQHAYRIDPTHPWLVEELTARRALPSVTRRAADNP